MSGWKEDGVGEVGARVAGGGRECLSRYGQGQKATWGAKVGGATRRSTCASCAPSPQTIQVLLVTEQGVCCTVATADGALDGIKEQSCRCSFRFFLKEKKSSQQGEKIRSKRCGGKQNANQSAKLKDCYSVRRALGFYFLFF
jgi:hypothetical protein